MLSVAIHKDIAEYQPKVIGKLTGRSLISITVALGLSIAVAVYMNLVLKIDPTDHLEFIYDMPYPSSIYRRNAAKVVESYKTRRRNGG